MKQCYFCDRTLPCVPFMTYNNDGKKSFMKEVFACIECIEKGGWKVDDEWRAKLQ